MDDKINHLNIIQSIVARMANNSFLLKGWAVTLASALFALSAKDSNPSFAFVAVVPVTILWMLDAYYLKQERVYRRLYDSVRRGDVAGFSLDTTEASKAEPRIVPFWTPTLSVFYVSILASIVFVTRLIKP